MGDSEAVSHRDAMTGRAELLFGCVFDPTGWVMTPDDDSELSVIETGPPEYHIRIESPDVGSVLSSPPFRVPLGPDSFILWRECSTTSPRGHG